MNYRDEKLSAVLARAAERQLSDFTPQEVANTAWVFATVNHRDEKLVAALAMVAEWRLSEFDPQAVANMAWAFATLARVAVAHQREKLFAALARVAGQHLRHAEHCSSVVCVGAILMECEQREWRDIEIALLKELVCVMSSLGSEMELRTAAKCAIAAERTHCAECCEHDVGAWS